MPVTLVARHKPPKAPVGALDHQRFSGASYYWEPPRPSSSPYAVPARYSNTQCPSLLTKRLTWPKFRVWRPGQVPNLPYAITETSLTSLTPRLGHPLQPGQQHPPQAESVYADSSGPLFSMYLKLAGEEDEKMTENWKGDADGILIFVSCHSTCITPTQIDPETEDWSILRRRRSICCGIRPGPQAEFPGHLSVLPRKHLSNPQWIPGRYSPYTSRSVHSIFSTNLCRVGQLALVSQLAHQSHMRTFGHITPAMGPSVHEDHPDTIQSTQTSTDSRVLC